MSDYMTTSCQPFLYGWNQSPEGAPCSSFAQNKHTATWLTESKAEKNHRAWIIALEKRGIASNLGTQLRDQIPPHSPQVLWESKNNYRYSQRESAGKGAREELPKTTFHKLQSKWLRKQSQSTTHKATCMNLKQSSEWWLQTAERFVEGEKPHYLLVLV